MKMEKEIAELRQKLDEHEKRIAELEKIKEKKPKMVPSERKSTEELLIELKDTSFFDEKRTISQIRDALHTKGRIVKITDLPPYLLKLVRNDILKRERQSIGKRKTWVYFA